MNTKLQKKQEEISKTAPAYWDREERATDRRVFGESEGKI